MAPEVLGAKYDEYLEEECRGYDLKCDIWSIGVITYVLMTKSQPFKETDDQNLKNSILNFNHETAECFTREEFKDNLTKSA